MFSMLRTVCLLVNFGYYVQRGFRIVHSELFMKSERNVITRNFTVLIPEICTEPDPERIRSPATFFGFGSGFEFSEKV